jgi:hypothetical protein
MALKKKITKEVWEKLSKDLQGEYTEKDGSYLLSVDGEEDTGALKRAKDREKERADDLQTKLAALQEQLDNITDKDARKAGDIKTLEASWQKKLVDAETASKAKIDKLNAFVNKTLIDGKANELAAKISTVPVLMSKAIRERMTVDFTGDEPKLLILGIDGKASDMTIEKLSEEFVANKEFSSIMIGSKARGSANPSPTKPAGGAGNSNDKPTILAKLAPADLAAELKARKEAQ